MHGWKHWLMGAGFFGFAVVQLFSSGSYWLVGLCVGASFYLFYRALAEETGGAGDDLELAVGFVQNPYETLFDEAVGQLTGGDEERPSEPQKPGLIQSLVSNLDTRHAKPDPKPFDADAAIARYLANRPAPEAPPRQGFGRKRA